jgi:hypothetical protein
MKPIREWLRQLPEDIWERILIYQNTEVQRKHWDFECKNLATAINGAIFWDFTSEGGMFWRYVSDGNYEDARLFFSKEFPLPSAEPIKGFVELTYKYGVKKRFVAVSAISGFEKYGEGCLVTFDGKHVEFEETYEEVARLITQATK